MLTLLVALLLQSPDTFAAFLATLEEARTKGATHEELIKKIDEWSRGKPDEIVARVAWDRALIEASIRMDALLADGLKRRIGQSVTFGKTAGIVREVKADRVVLGMSTGSVEVRYWSLPFDARVEDIKRQGLLPEKSSEEAIFRFAAARTVAALAPARAIPAVEPRYRTLSAIAGAVLQDADRGLAGGSTLKVAEDFAANWSKQDDLLAAGNEAIRKFIDGTLGPKMAAEIETTFEKDRKAARRLVDLGTSLCKEAEILSKIGERRWDVLDKGEWMSIPFDSVMQNGGTTKDKALEFEDTNEAEDRVTGLEITAIPVSWSEVAGVRARLKPVKGDVLDMRLTVGKPAKAYSVAINLKELYARTVKFEEKKPPETGKGSTRKVAPKKGEVELAIQWEGKKWKFFAAGTELDTMEVAEEPHSILFLASQGSAELTEL